MSAVRLRYSLLGERWSIEKVGREGRFDLVPSGDDVYVARDDANDVVEVVIDRPEVPSDVIDFVTANFDGDLRPYLGMTPSTDLEVTLGEVDSGAGDSEIVVANESSPPVPWRITIAVRPLPGEPGVPVANSPQLFEAPVAIDPILARGTDDSSLVRHVQIEQRSKESEIVVTVNGVLPGGPWWVRMSEGATGTTVALGRLEETVVNRAVNGGLRREPAMSTRMTYGLDVPLPDLHVSVSDTPLIDVGDREQRRRQWAVDLEARAETTTASDPKYASRLWSDAADVYDAIGDEPGANRCRLRADESRRRVRRRTLAVVLTAIAVVTGLVIAAIAIFSGDDDGDGDGAVPAVAETMAPAETVPPTIAPAEELPLDAGPFEVQFDPQLRAVVSLGDVDGLTPGSILKLTVLASVRIQNLYDRIGCLAVEEGLPPSQVGPITGPVPTYEVQLRRPLINGSFDRIELEPFAVKREIAAFQAPPGQCTFGIENPAELADIDVDITFGSTDVEWTLPADIEPGVWEVVLINGVGVNDNDDGRRLAFRVTE